MICLVPLSGPRGQTHILNLTPQKHLESPFFIGPRIPQFQDSEVFPGSTAPSPISLPPTPTFVWIAPAVKSRCYPRCCYCRRSSSACGGLRGSVGMILIAFSAFEIRPLCNHQHLRATTETNLAMVVSSVAHWGRPRGQRATSCVCVSLSLCVLCLFAPAFVIRDAVSRCPPSIHNSFYCQHPLSLSLSLAGYQRRGGAGRATLRIKIGIGRHTSTTIIGLPTDN